MKKNNIFDKNISLWCDNKPRIILMNWGKTTYGEVNGNSERTRIFLPPHTQKSQCLQGACDRPLVMQPHTHVHTPKNYWESCETHHVICLKFGEHPSSIGIDIEILDLNVQLLAFGPLLDLPPNSALLKI